MKKQAVLAFAFTIIASFYFSQIIVNSAEADHQPEQSTDLGVKGGADE